MASGAMRITHPDTPHLPCRTVWPCLSCESGPSADIPAPIAEDSYDETKTSHPGSTVKTMIKRINSLVGRHGQLNWILLDQALVSGVNFLTTILLVRTLGLEQFGWYSVAWLILLLVKSMQAAIIVSPMYSLRPKQYVDDRGAYDLAVLCHQGLFLVLSVVLIAIATLGAEGLVSGWSTAAMSGALIALVGADQLQEFTRRYFFASNRQSWAFLNDLICYGGRTAVLVALWYSSTGDVVAGDALWVMVWPALISAVVGFALIIRAAALAVDWTRQRAVLAQHWRFARWLLGASIVEFGATQLSTLIAAVVLGVTALGAIRATYNVMGAAYVLFQALYNLVPIRASAHYMDVGVGGMMHYLRRVSVIGGSATLAIGAVVAAAPEFWLHLFYGGYMEYGALMYWQAALALTVFFFLPLHSAFRAFEETRPIFMVDGMQAVLSISLGFIMAHLFGIHGFMASMLLTKIVALTCLVVLLGRRIGTSPIRATPR